MLKWILIDWKIHWKESSKILILDISLIEPFITDEKFASDTNSKIETHILSCAVKEGNVMAQYNPGAVWKL